MSTSQATRSADELSVRLFQQELVAAFGLHALRGSALDDVLQEACGCAARGLSTQFAKVLQFRPVTDDFLVCAGVGWRDGVIGNAVLGSDLASPAGYALRTKLPVLSNHLSQESRFRTPALLVDHGIHRALNVIVEDGDGLPFGVLEVDSTDRNDFNEHDTAFVQSLANAITASVRRHARDAARELLLREKDVLMQEVHHRVKNSLQLVQTMLQLQARGLGDTVERGRLEEAANRIMTIAAVHRRLHQGESILETDAQQYIGGLIDDLRDAVIDEAGARSIDVEVTPMTLTADHITPLGLITTELVTNALKYGTGRIAVRVLRESEGIRLTVEDEGPGFPAALDPARSRSLGMRLITALARNPAAIAIDRSVPFGRVAVQTRIAPSA